MSDQTVNRTMGYGRIAAMQTVVSDDTPNCHRWHESVMRSYQILQKVKWLLALDTKPIVVLELIDLMESAPEKEP